MGKKCIVFLRLMKRIHIGVTTAREHGTRWQLQWKQTKSWQRGREGVCVVLGGVQWTPYTGCQQTTHHTKTLPDRTESGRIALWELEFRLKWDREAHNHNVGIIWVILFDWMMDSVCFLGTKQSQCLGCIFLSSCSNDITQALLLWGPWSWCGSAHGWGRSTYKRGSDVDKMLDSTERNVIYPPLEGTAL